MIIDKWWASIFTSLIKIRKKQRIKYSDHFKDNFITNNINTVLLMDAWISEAIYQYSLDNR